MFRASARRAPTATVSECAAREALPALPSLQTALSRARGVAEEMLIPHRRQVCVGRRESARVVAPPCLEQSCRGRLLFPWTSKRSAVRRSANVCARKVAQLGAAAPGSPQFFCRPTRLDAGRQARNRSCRGRSTPATRYSNSCRRPCPRAPRITGPIRFVHVAKAPLEVPSGAGRSGCHGPTLHVARRSLQRPGRPRPRRRDR